MRAIIDRFEGNTAVLELYHGKKTVNAPRELFKGAREGDTVEIRVLGKTDTESPHVLFERLRAKSRRKLNRRRH